MAEYDARDVLAGVVSRATTFTAAGGLLVPGVLCVVTTRVVTTVLVTGVDEPDLEFFGFEKKLRSVEDWGCWR